VPFKDTYAIAGTGFGGSGHTNGTYLGVRMTGGIAIGCMAKVTIAGGAMTAVDIGGTGSGATFTLTTITTATGSFTDTAGNKWQITTDAEAFPNVRQFGARIDWAGNDATATNDLLSFQSAIAFASIQNGSAASLLTGGKAICPKRFGAPLRRRHTVRDATGPSESQPPGRRTIQWHRAKAMRRYQRHRTFYLSLRSQRAVWAVRLQAGRHDLVRAGCVCQRYCRGLFQ
jgi:hypothetical protein